MSSGVHVFGVIQSHWWFYSSEFLYTRFAVVFSIKKDRKEEDEQFHVTGALNSLICGTNIMAVCGIVRSILSLKGVVDVRNPALVEVGSISRYVRGVYTLYIQNPPNLTLYIPKKLQIPPEVWCFRQVMRVQTSSFFGGGPGCHPGYPSLPWGENAEETTDPMSCRYRSFHQDLGKSNLEEAATGLLSGNLNLLLFKELQLIFIIQV